VPISRWYASSAWLDGAVASDVLIDVRIDGEDGRITNVQTGVSAAPDGTHLPGLVLPGLANAHSHAFHRGLRGRTERGRGTFWTWRDRMYELAGALTPDTYRALARAVYAEMALAGITCVGEFHYLHHAPGGARYGDPNAMGHALLAAAADAGIRITLLDTVYLSATVDGHPLQGVQRRFGDGDVDGWWRRHAELRADSHARIASAAHSVRAVPAAQLSAVSAAVGDTPLHMHLSEQRAENEACLAVHGRTPTELLADHGLLGPALTAIHATHLTDSDRTELGDTGTAICLCPTTERDLADGIGPGRALLDAGAVLCLGSDSHAIVDPFEEMRAMETHERLRTERRGHFTQAELLHAAGPAGHTALGWPDAGRIAVGYRADLVAVALDSPRTAGAEPDAAVFAATAADVTHVIVDGRWVVRDGVHCGLSDVGGALRTAIAAVTG
jgi:formiminoglutamate deiminase